MQSAPVSKRGSYFNLTLREIFLKNFRKIITKKRIFGSKKSKNFAAAGGFAPDSHLTPAAGGSAPQTPDSDPLKRQTLKALFKNLLSAPSPPARTTTQDEN